MAHDAPNDPLVWMWLHWLQVYIGEIHLIQRLHRIAHGIADPVGVVKGCVTVHLNMKFGPHLWPYVVSDHPVYTLDAFHLAGHIIDPLHNFWRGGPSGEIAQVLRQDLHRIPENPYLNGKTGQWIGQRVDPTGCHHADQRGPRRDHIGQVVRG